MVIMQKSHYQAEVSQLGKERDWLLTTYASNIIAQIDSLLKDCTRRLPTSSQRQPTSTMQTDKFTLVARNDTGKGDALRCVLTLMADNVLQAELSVRYARAPGGVFRSVAQPDVQCKLEQVMDLTNYVQRCGLAIATAFRLLRAHCGAPAGGGAARAEALMIVLLDMMENISLARDCLLAPRRRSFSELASCQLNRSFNPALPPDLLFSLYASAGKLVVAVYHLQNGGGQPATQQQPNLASSQSYHVCQLDAPVQWLSDALNLLTLALHCAQQLKDKLALFLDVPDLRANSGNVVKHAESDDLAVGKAVRF